MDRTLLNKIKGKNGVEYRIYLFQPGAAGDDGILIVAFDKEEKSLKGYKGYESADLQLISDDKLVVFLPGLTEHAKTDTIMLKQ